MQTLHGKCNAGLVLESCIGIMFLCNHEYMDIWKKDICYISQTLKESGKMFQRLLQQLKEWLV